MMTDRGKVIRGLEEFKADLKPFSGNHADWQKVDDALELLKAKEPKPPIVKENAYGWKFFYCPSCGREFNANRKHGRVNEENFCDKCGQAVKWDEPPKEET